jgi:predicted metal-binding protein
MTEASMPSTLVDIALGVGFEQAAEASADILTVNPLVRDACTVNRCHSYGRNWVCPPACGDLEHYATQLAALDRVLLVQTVTTLEDDYDYEGMMAAAAMHRQRFRNLANTMQQEQPDDFANMLFLSAGACDCCRECSYPDAPCRFPDQAFVSMEAAGLLVSEVCEKAGISYYNGRHTITYTSCLVY